MLSSAQVTDRTLVHPVNALPALINRNSSGRAVFYSPEDESIGWRVHYSNGQVHFATALEGQKQRLQYLLPRVLPEVNLAHFRDLKVQNDYDYLCQFWQSGRTPIQILRRTLLSFTQEALTYLLSMPQANLTVEGSVGLDPILISVTLSPLIRSIRESAQQWKQYAGDIISPLQRLQVNNIDRVIEYWHTKGLIGRQGTTPIANLEVLVANNLCLYEVAQLLEIDLTTLMDALQTLVSLGAVTIVSYQMPAEVIPDHRPLIACIDDSRTMRAIIRSILEPAGYKVLEIVRATEAVSVLQKSQPSVILMDISMPGVDGYELCSIIKRTNLRNIPVVMLTGREGVIDRVRARFVGATEYMTKPFDPDHLISLVQNLVAA